MSLPAKRACCGVATATGCCPSATAAALGEPDSDVEDEPPLALALALELALPLAAAAWPELTARERPATEEPNEARPLLLLECSDSEVAPP
jgi:hypothetical protein